MGKGVALEVQGCGLKLHWALSQALEPNLVTRLMVTFGPKIE